MARRYYFQGVDSTPYSLVMATPLEYGEERVKASHDTSLTSSKCTNGNKLQSGMAFAGPPSS